MTTLIFGIGILSLIVIVSGFGEATAIDFVVPSPSSPIPDIVCAFQVSLFEIDSTGNTIDVTVSSIFFANPVLASIIDPSSGKKVAGWTAVPSALCRGATDIEIENTLFAQWEVRDTVPINDQFKVVGLSEVKSGSKVITSNTPKQINSFGLFADDAEKEFVTGGLKELVVRIDGLLTLNYVGFPNIKYYFDVPDIVTSTIFNIVLPESVPDESTRDSDLDGIIDKFDECKFEKEVFNGFLDGDGCPDAIAIVRTGNPLSRNVIDTDRDGIPDFFDQCPLSSESFNGFQDGDGCPDILPEPEISPERIVKPIPIRSVIEQVRNIFSPSDIDGDGIPDDRDDCPTQKEVFNGRTDFDGCPDKVEFAGVEFLSPIQIPIPPEPLVSVINEFIQRIVSLFTGD